MYTVEACHPPLASGAYVAQAMECEDKIRAITSPKDYGEIFVALDQSYHSKGKVT